MATYYCVDSRPAAGIPGEVHTSKLNDLGAVREFSVDGVVNSFIYLQGVGSTVTGSWVAFDPGTYTTALLASTSKGQCAVAMGAVNATTSYGWYGYIGSFAAFNLSATLSNTPLFAGSAGAGTSAVTKNAQIKKCVVRGAPPTATGGATQTCVIDRPFIGSYDESV